MAKQLDPQIRKIVQTYYEGDPKTALWDCHGTWVVYHRAVEQMAAKAGIRFDPPAVLQAPTNEPTVAILVTGHLADRAEWSIGEAAPKNNKNAYPWAMAEKRAKDRVALKLIGLHGLAYSEEEADAFKEHDQQNGHPAQPPPGTAPFDEIESKPGEIEHDIPADVERELIDALHSYMLLGADLRELGTYTDPCDWLEAYRGAIDAMRTRKELHDLAKANQAMRRRILHEHEDNDDVLDMNNQVKALVEERDAELKKDAA